MTSDPDRPRRRDPSAARSSLSNGGFSTEPIQPTLQMAGSSSAGRERVTLSIGLAGWRSGESPDDWHARADAALYAAKRGGRNQVVEAAADVG